MLIQIDTRLGGRPRYFLAEAGVRLMRVPDQVRESVAFIGSTDSSGQRFLGGTAFFLSQDVEGFEGKIVVYAVTAAHVIHSIRKKNRKGWLRVNLANGGTQFIDFDLDHWFMHPTDSSVDAAMMPFTASFQSIDAKTLPSAMVMTDAIVEEHRIGIGEEVFITGLFVNHAGRERNIPILRVGTIAAMPEEKVSSGNWGDLEAYLIEARSIGGLSGSPVFAHLDVVQVRDGQASISTFEYGPFYWMGLVHGHYDGKVAEFDVVEDAATSTTEKVNVGIAIVVPATRVLELLEHHLAKQHHDQARNQLSKETGVVMDIASEALSAEPFTKTDFEDALKKVSRKLSDEEKS